MKFSYGKFTEFCFLITDLSYCYYYNIISLRQLEHGMS